MINHLQHLFRSVVGFQFRAGSRVFFLSLFGLLANFGARAQEKPVAVIAYYSGGPERLDSFDVSQLTHLIYCFGHLEGNRMHIHSANDSLLIQKMVALKQRNANLKVLLSLGGWGGCASCSEVFATAEGRANFAQSVNELSAFFRTDGVDLDWEYPSIPGYPGHHFSPDDKSHFTALLQTLRDTLGPGKIVSFAAGGFQRYLDEAVDWSAVAPLVNYINLMSYDLVNGYATTTGHHTPLYATAQQTESVDNAVQVLLKKGVAPEKIVIGAAFYGRVWEGVPADNNGLYQPGKFKKAVNFRQFPQQLSREAGFTWYWDDTAKALYAYNPTEHLFATFDDQQSVAGKTAYVLRQHLGGIMFWELGGDTVRNGLLQSITDTIKKAQ